MRTTLLSCVSNISLFSATGFCGVCNAVINSQDRFQTHVGECAKARRYEVLQYSGVL